VSPKGDQDSAIINLVDFDLLMNHTMQRKN